jgi:hypothetical protein
MAKAAPLPSVDKSEKAQRYREKCGDLDRGILPIQPRSLIGVIVCIRGHALGAGQRAKRYRLRLAKLSRLAQLRLAGLAFSGAGGHNPYLVDDVTVGPGFGADSNRAGVQRCDAGAF